MTTTTNHSTRQPLAIVSSEPERLFRVERVTQRDTVVSATMPTGPWLERGDRRISGGALGVLFDNVLGYGVMVDRPVDHWSVSSEISIDVCRPIEPGARLSARARPLSSDSRGAITSGEVVDEQGRLIAVGRQHGRYVDRLPDLLTDAAVTDHPTGEATHPEAEAPTIFDLLDLTPRLTDRGAVLDVVASRALLNPLGNLHGGITLCLADLTAITALEAGSRALDVASIHVAYLRPVPAGTSISFTASVLHAGRSFALARVDVRDASGKLCSAATLTAAPR